MDLTTTYLGKSLRTPLVASASPLSKEIDGIKALEDAGASAIVLFSLFEEQLVQEQKELHYHTSHHYESFAEALTYFPEPENFKVGSEKYLEHIRKAKQAVDIPIFASLNGNTIGGWTEFAKQIEEAGADGLELNIYDIPTDLRLTGAQVEANYIDIVKAIRGAVNIPVAVKLSPYFSNTANMAYQLSEAGANALVLFNRFYQPDIDLDNLEVKPNVLLSTPQALRLPLRWIAILFGRVEVEFGATSGVHSGEDVIKMMMVGANVTMMASTLLRHGVKKIAAIEDEIVRWMQDNDYESITQMRGSMSLLRSGDPHGFERAQYMRAVSSIPSEFLNR
jgi:dihydroorotate dehydrogenase (fumarate)